MADVYAIIEIPLGCQVKYEYDKKLGMLKVDRVLHTSFAYPFNYGFIPSTTSPDGDELDIIVISSKAFYPLSLVKCRVIGGIKIIDSGITDDKIVAVPCDEPEYSQVKNISDLPLHYRKLVEHFFSHYKDLEGKEVKVVGWFNASKAIKLVKQYSIKS